MVKNTTTLLKKPVQRKSATKKVTTKVKPVVAKVTKKAKKTVRRPQASDKVDYYPNRMTVAVSALAGTILVLVAVIAVLGSRS